MPNLYWKSITEDQKVKETSTGWKVGNKTVYWHGQEARRAQTWLHNRAMKDKRKGKRKRKRK